MPKILATYLKIEIIGSPSYVKQVKKSLSFLKIRAPRNFRTVQKYIGRIEEFMPSSMAPHENPPTFYLSRKLAFSSLTFCASSIVHDAHHSKLFLDYWRKNKSWPPFLVYGGRKIELECIKRQLAFSKKVGAPRKEIEWISKQDGMHYKIEEREW